MASEKWLIDVNVCLHDMCKRCNIENEGCPCEPADCFIYNVLENAPTVDAVEVVRCKDCKNWGGVVYGGRCKYWSAPMYGMTYYTSADDFCSHGERRDNG